MLEPVFVAGFNSTLVQLKEGSVVTQDNTGASFNSTLVQLKGRMKSLKQRAKEKFQFHVGSIKRKKLSSMT